MIFDTLLWVWGAETHPGTSVSKRLGHYLWLKHQVGKNFAILNIFFMWYLQRPPLHKTKFKYQNWYLTPYCGLEVQIPNQALQSVKGPHNVFDWNPKWARTLPSFIYFSWDMYRDHPPQKKIHISNLIFDTLLWAWGAETQPGTSVS